MRGALRLLRSGTRGRHAALMNYETYNSSYIGGYRLYTIPGPDAAPIPGRGAGGAAGVTSESEIDFAIGTQE